MERDIFCLNDGLQFINAKIVIFQNISAILGGFSAEIGLKTPLEGHFGIDLCNFGRIFAEIALGGAQGVRRDGGGEGGEGGEGGGSGAVGGMVQASGQDAHERVFSECTPAA